MVTFSCFMPFKIVAHKKYDFINNACIVYILHKQVKTFFVKELQKSSE